MTFWLAGAGGVFLFLLGITAGKYNPLIHFLWLVYILVIVGLILLWVKHVNSHMENILQETPDQELSKKNFSVGICEFTRIDRNLSRVYRKMQLTEYALLNQKARQAGENFNLMLSNTTDPLTGIPNRRQLDRHLEKVTGKMIPMSVIMLDIDHFKMVNDTYGHDVGDLVIRQFASVVKTSVRPADFLGRYGGEEFMVICGADRKEAAEIAERVRHAVSARPVNVSDGQAINITASLGVAEYVPGDSPRSLIDRADKALYTAKQTGRNRVEKEADLSCAG